MIGDFVEYAIRGLPIGCVFGLLAVGLVLTYKTSGVFNLALSAQAYAAAAVFYVLRRDLEWPLLPAAFVPIFLVSPLIGVLLDRYLYRYQRTAGSLAKLVTSLGLLVAIPEIVQLWFGQEPKKNPPVMWWVRRSDEFTIPAGGGRFALDAGQIAAIGSTALVVIGLTILFRRGGIGLRMRAVVESPRLVQLQGIDADAVSRFSWILSSAIAGLAGVLIAPLFAELTPIRFFVLLVGAVAASVVGRLSSIPLAMLGGLGLGVLQAVLSGFLPSNSVLSTGLRPALPFVVLFGLLLVPRWARTRGDVPDPLAGVDPPPVRAVASLRPPWLTNATRIFAVGAAVVGLFVSFFVIDDYWLGLVTAGAALSVILLSIITTTGVGGTISLCQATFAAIGAFTTAQLVDHLGIPVLLGMVAGGLLAALVGAALSLPIVRLAGIYPALATLAFALFFEGVLVPQSWVSGGRSPIAVPRPLIGSVDLSDDRAFLVLCVVLLVVFGAAVSAVREGTTGRFLDAIRGSEAAARSVGINPGTHRTAAFIMGAGIAGFGGGLLASFSGQANYEASFNFYFGLVWLVLVITAGSRSVQSAVISGISFFVFPQLLARLFTWPGNFLESHPDVDGVAESVLSWVQPEWAYGVAFVLFGFGALTYAKHPEGIIEAQTTAAIRRTLSFAARLRSRSDAPPVTDTPVGTAP